MSSYSAIAELPIADLRLADLFEETLATVRRSDRGYNSRPTDQGGSLAYPAALMQPLRLSQSIVGGRFGGLVSRSQGEVEIADLAGDLATTVETQRIDGRRIVVKVLDVPADGSKPSLDDARTVFEGLGRDWRVNAERVGVLLSDCGRCLSVTEAQGDRFTGTGGAEGGDDLKGRPKPLALGYVWNAEPVYLGTIAGKHSFLVSAGWALPIQDVPAARDRGVALTKVGGTPTSGEYAIDTATGILTIGGDLPEQLTVDIEGYVRDGTFVSSAADLVLAILQDRAGLRDTQIDQAALDALDGVASAAQGLWQGATETTVERVIGDLAESVGFWAGFDRLGKFTAGLLGTPAGVIRADIGPGDIVRRGNRDMIERLPLPERVAPAVWRVVVHWQRAETVQTDMAAGAAEADREFAAVQARHAPASTGTVRQQHPQARQLEVAGRYRLEADARSEAQRLLALYAPGLARFRVTVTNQSPELDVGQTVQLTYPRWGLAAGVLATIVSVSTDAARAETDLEVYVRP